MSKQPFKKTPESSKEVMYAADKEANIPMDTFKPGLKRQMKDRHIVMIRWDLFFMMLDPPLICCLTSSIGGMEMLTPIAQVSPSR